MTISDSTLSTTFWTDTRAIIVAAAPYVTNSTTSGTTAASINAAYNDKTASRPQIIINPINYSEDTYKFGSNQGKKLINLTVDCYASNSLGMDQLADQVIDAMKGTDIDDAEIVAISTDVAFVNPNEAKFHLKSITFTYDRE